MIKVQNLTKQYGKFTALKDVSFEVKKGEILGFLGPNGAGKTTAMRIITGFLPPTSGTVTIGDYDIMDNSIECRRMIGYLPETVPLYDDLIVRESLKFYARIKGVLSKDINNAVERTLHDCRIEDVQNKLIRTLSKGYRQRVGLAQALISNPEILILDEPTIGLDPKQIIEIRELIRGFSGKRTVILSSHILPEVSVICNRIAIIHKGQLIAQDSEENLTRLAQKGPNLLMKIKGPNKNITSALMEKNFIKTVTSDKSNIPSVYDYSIVFNDSPKNRQELSKLVFDNSWDLLSMEPVSSGLERIFIDLVNRYEEARA
ncbi:MAG: ABC transporter ATP-binding protein [Acidobacteria bacterium]|nr:ABC transporter ATP-binding protein [Acidobacteriota bacterium]